jgi:hypothetical protein
MCLTSTRVVFAIVPAVLLAMCSLCQAADDETDFNAVVQVDPVANPRFPDVNIQPPRIKSIDKDPASGHLIVTFEKHDAALFEPRPRLSRSSAGRPVVHPVPRVFQFDVQIHGTSSFKPEIWFLDANSDWRPAPPSSYISEAHGEIPSVVKLSILPAACGTRLDVESVILVGVRGYESKKLMLASDVQNSILLAPLPKTPQLPAELAELFPDLADSGYALSLATYRAHRPRELIPPWYRAEACSADTALFFPGFMPMHLDPHGSFIVSSGNNWQRYKDWPKGYPRRGELQVALGLDSPDWLNKRTPGTLERCDVGVYFNGKLIGKSEVRPMAFGPVQRFGAGFDLPQLYSDAVKQTRHLGPRPASFAFWEFERKAEFRLIDRKTQEPAFYSLTEYSAPDLNPYTEGSAAGYRIFNFGVGLPVHARGPCVVPLKARFNEVWVSLDFGKGAIPRRWWDETEFIEVRTAEGGGEEEIRVSNQFWTYSRSERPEIVFIPALIGTGRILKYRLRHASLGTAEIELTSPLDIEPKIARFGGAVPAPTGGLRILLPSGLPDTATPRLIVQPADRARAEIVRTLPPQPADQTLRELGELDGATVELLLPGFRPLKIENFKGKLIDARKQEPIKGRFLVVVNNWASIVSSNEQILDDINVLQQTVCEQIIELAKESESVRVMNFAIVQPDEANWPKGASVRSFLATGEQPPIPTQARREGNRPDDIWKSLRQLLSHTDIVSRHDVVEVVLVTPFEGLPPGSGEAVPGSDKAWIQDRLRDRVRLKTIVIGGPELRALNAEKLKSFYFDPQVLKVGRKGIDFGRDQDETVEKLPEWLKNEILK